jgi:hypothetical protein
MKFAEYLQKTEVCYEALAWVGEKDFPTAWRKCKRGDWMLWFAQKAKLCNSRKLTLMKARCAELVRPHMRDERSLAALDAAFAYAAGQMKARELAKYAADAKAVAADAAFAAAFAAEFAADTAYAYAVAYYAANAAAYYAATADGVAYADAAKAAAAARAAVLARCADICRKILPAPILKF